MLEEQDQELLVVEIHHLRAELAKLRKVAERLAPLVKRAAEDSCTTSGYAPGFGGPGCFYCDIEEGHTPDCEAVAALAEFEAAAKEQP